MFSASITTIPVIIPHAKSSDRSTSVPVHPGAMPLPLVSEGVGDEGREHRSAER